MKKSRVLFLLLIILFLTITVISVVYFFYTTIAIKEYPMLLLVGDKVGIDVGTDIIRFGMVQPGGGSTRIFTLTNNNPMNIMVKFLVFGELKRRVSFSDNNFVMAPNQKKEVHISAGVPEDMPYGNYTGKLRVILKRNI